MWQDVLTKEQFENSWINPHRCKATCLLKMCQGILTEDTFEKVWSYPHWWKATCLLKMWKDIHTKGIFENTWTYSYWQKATCLFKMWQDIHTIGHFKRHQLIHTGVKPYSVSWEKPHVCSKYAKTFCLVGSLKTHKLIHSWEILHACLKCNKTFTKKDTFENILTNSTQAKSHMPVQNVARHSHKKIWNNMN